MSRSPVLSRARSSSGKKPNRRVVWQAASLALSYPEQTLLGHGPMLRQATAEAGTDVAARFADLLNSWETTELTALQTEYVDVFDLSRKRALHLSYWTEGDTRRRGQVLADFKSRYRRSGFLVKLYGELPDFLPLVLEYAAVADPLDGAELLQEYRPSLELLRLALMERSPRHGRVVEAICATLPGESPTDRRAVQAMARSGPPTESVGLAPYDPRLLPVVEGR
ncbi:MAG TPA: nitrate reductase molybdenum cofactor assembly chaperone [Propionibacteriaceae bacterium]|nr:nitrate reductase molybdenum cofactor assembly chaperone [Propionibacteriaceae bacterium]